MNELVSVVIPVYNVEKYLEYCVRSVMAQTYQNIEIILVDDGSLDESARICENLAKADSRIKVFHKTNGGLSDARNYGISKAKGCLITFIDSDDYVSPNYIDSLLVLREKYHADISACNFERVCDRSQLREINRVEKTEILMNGEEACINQISSSCEYNTALVVAWGKLYPIDLVRRFPFPLGVVHEDEATTYKYFLSTGKIAFTSVPLYAYYQNPEGIMSTLKKMDMETNRRYTEILIERAEYFETMNMPHLAKKARFITLNHLIDDSTNNSGRSNKKILELIFMKWGMKKIDKSILARVAFLILMPHLYRLRRRIVYQ